MELLFDYLTRVCKYAPITYIRVDFPDYLDTSSVVSTAHE